MSLQFHPSVVYFIDSVDLLLCSRSLPSAHYANETDEDRWSQNLTCTAMHVKLLLFRAVRQHGEEYLSCFVSTASARIFNWALC